MNIYVVVEGEVVEVKTYRSWIPYLRPELSYVDHVSKIASNNFSIVSGFGYPQYFEIVNDAIQDVNNHGLIDRLLFVVDTENLSVPEKLAEIHENVDISKCKAQFCVIFQHFCIEAWALGNRKFFARRPQNHHKTTNCESSRGCGMFLIRIQKNCPSSQLSHGTAQILLTVISS